MNGPTPPARTCGACAFCCKAMGIAELRKPAGVWCPHRTGPTGCAIHGAHPASCRAFACQWLLTEDLPAKYRPDRTKVVLTGSADGRVLLAHCDPNNALAWRREPIYGHLKREAARTQAAGMAVLAKAGARHWQVTPTHDIDLGEIPEGASINVRRAPDGSAEVRVGPRPSPAES